MLSRRRALCKQGHELLVRVETRIVYLATRGPLRGARVISSRIAVRMRHKMRVLTGGVVLCLVSRSGQSRERRTDRYATQVWSALRVRSNYLQSAWDAQGALAVYGSDQVDGSRVQERMGCAAGVDPTWVMRIR